MSNRNRMYFLDNLRTFMIFCVVLYHAGVVYEASGIGASFWIVDDPSTNDLAGLVNLVIDIFVMPILFFVSGYLTPMSLKNKSGWVFLKSKFRRLIIPWMIAVLTVIPLLKVIFLYSRNLPQQSWTTYFHFSNGNLSQSWLWFLPVLFLFDLLYLLLAKINLVPTKISLKLAVGVIFIVGMIYSFGMEIFGLSGWTLTPLLDFQNERLLLYFMIFLLGSLALQQNAFATKPTHKRMYIFVNLTVWIPILIYIFFLLIPFLNPGASVTTPVVDRLIVWLSFYLSLFSLLYVFIQTFWRYVDRTGRIWEELNRNSYAVYIIHVVVMGVIALVLLNSAMSSVLKYFTLTVSTYIASNLIVSLYRMAVEGIRSISQPAQESEIA
jgi:fucose 4-O-acetylase-like acetyltransferase